MPAINNRGGGNDSVTAQGNFRGILDWIFLMESYFCDSIVNSEKKRKRTHTKFHSDLNRSSLRNNILMAAKAISLELACDV